MATLSSLVVKLSLDARKYQDGLEKARGSAKKSGSAIKRGMTGATDVLRNVALAAGVTGAALYTAKKAFDFGAEGQKLIQVEDRYQTLVDTIGGGQGTLQKLVDVTGNQVENYSAMAAAASLMELKLAESEGELEKHFEIVSRLKKPHEDFSTALENWSLLLANKSIPRLDSFGLSGSQVRENWKKLTAVIGDSDKAFKLAVLEEAEKSMARLGDAVPIDEFAVATVQWTNFMDSLKVGTAKGIGPAVAGLSEWGEKSSSASRLVTALDDDLDKHLQIVKEVQRKTSSVADETAVYNRIIEMLENNVKGSTEELVGWAKAGVIAEKRAELLADQYAELDGSMGGVIRVNEEFNDKLLIQAARLSEAEIATRDQQAALVAQAAAAELAAEKFSTLSSAMGTSVEAIGLWSEGINFELRAIAMREKLAELEEKVRGGEISWYEALTAAQLYRTELGYMGDAIAALPLHKRIEIELTFTGNAVDDLLHGGGTVGGFLPPAATGGGVSPGGVPGGNIPEFAHGGDFIVPGGGPFPMVVHPGEHVQVTPRGDDGGGDTTYNYILNLESGRSMEDVRMDFDMMRAVAGN